MGIGFSVWILECHFPRGHEIYREPFRKFIILFPPCEDTRILQLGECLHPTIWHPDLGTRRTRRTRPRRNKFLLFINGKKKVYLQEMLTISKLATHMLGKPRTCYFSLKKQEMSTEWERNVAQQLPSINMLSIQRPWAVPAPRTLLWQAWRELAFPNRAVQAPDRTEWCIQLSRRCRRCSPPALSPAEVSITQGLWSGKQIWVQSHGKGSLSLSSLCLGELNN